MPKAWLVFCFSVCLSSAREEDETRAWHLAVPPEAIHDAAAIPALPAPSVFASKGDQLLDLTKALRAEETFGNGAWIAWNGTRRLLIAHGNRHALDYADKLPFMRQPHHIGLTLAWHRGVALGAAVPPEAVPVHRCEMVMRSGMKFESKWKVENAGSLSEITVLAAPTLGEENSMADFGLDVGWQEELGGKRLCWNFDNSILIDGRRLSPLVIAQTTSPSGEVWTITAKARDLMVDGTPALSSRWMETGRKAEPVLRHIRSPQADKIGTVDIHGRTLTVAEFDVERSLVRELPVFAGEKERVPQAEKDPFSSAGANDPFATREDLDDERLPDYADAVVPVELREYAPVAMSDLKPIFVKLGMPLGETDFAGYDPRLQRLMVAFSNPAIPESVEDLFSPMCNLRAGPMLATVFRMATPGDDGNSAASGVKLLCLSGMRCQLRCDDAEGRSVLACEFEPIFGLSKEMADLRYDCQVSRLPGSGTLELKGNATLVAGSETVLQSAETGDRKTRVSVGFDPLPVMVEDP